MTESIRLEFLNMVNENEWMDEVSKQRAIQKVNNLYLYLFINEI